MESTEGKTWKGPWLLFVLSNILEGRIDVGSYIDSGSSCLMFFANIILVIFSPFLSHFSIRTWSKKYTFVRMHLVAIKVIKMLTWKSESKSLEWHFQSYIRFHLQGVETAYSLVLSCIHLVNHSSTHKPTAIFRRLFWGVEWLMIELF